MDGPPRSRVARGPIPFGLLGMVALVVAVESFVVRHELDFTPWGSSAWIVADRASRREATSCDVLFLGDSLVKMGLLPIVVEGETGRSAYNLGICAAQAPLPYFMLRRVLGAGGKPSAVVVDYKPNLLVGGPRDFARNWAELLTPREAIELAYFGGLSHTEIALQLNAPLGTVKGRVRLGIDRLRSTMGPSLGGAAPPPATSRPKARGGQGGQIPAM